MTERNLALAHAAIEEKDWQAAAAFAQAAKVAGLPAAVEVLAKSAWMQRDYAGAIEAYESLEDASPISIALLARLYLLMGELDRGWELVSKGFRTGIFGPSLYSLPHWNGENLDQRRVAVWGLGYGDDMLFARFVPALVATGAIVSLNCRPAMVRLFESLSGVDSVVPMASEIKDADFHIHLAELPSMFLKEAGDVWPGAPYMGATPAQLPGEGLRVGLVWGCDSLHWEAPERTAVLAQLAPLAGVHGVQLFSLQMGSQAAELNPAPVGFEIIDLGRDFCDFADTAAVIAGLDLVISIDTAVANLAGSMGKTVWVAVPFIPDWRWGREGEATPWYPSATVFRQPAAGDWWSVFRAMASRLEAWVFPISAYGTN